MTSLKRPALILYLIKSVAVVVDDAEGDVRTDVPVLERLPELPLADRYGSLGLQVRQLEAATERKPVGIELDSRQIDAGGGSFQVELNLRQLGGHRSVKYRGPDHFCIVAASAVPVPVKSVRRAFELGFQVKGAAWRDQRERNWP